MSVSRPKNYEKMKQEHPDRMLLFSVGDFYEMYGEDAVSAASILGITLHRHDTELAGFPHHALDTYLPKLNRAGHKVAICERYDTEKSLCRCCRFCLNSGKCNRLVVAGGFGNNDKVAKDLMKDGKCDYFEEGTPSKDENLSTGSVNYWNS